MHIALLLAGLAKGTTMVERLVADVLVVGEGCAGQVAALAASEQGCSVILLGDGRAPSTAISTGFLTFAAHEGFSAAQLHDAMANTTGKGLCDKALLRRLIEDGPIEMQAAIAAYGVPVERAERGLRAQRALGKRGHDLLVAADEDPQKHSTLDMTGLVMEFSSTHGTALYAQLRKAVTAASRIQRVKGSAVVLDPSGTTVGALVDGRSVTIAARAIVLATGGLQGLYEFSDTPDTLVGDGHGLAMDAGAAAVDMEFVQFYPLAVQEPGIPPIFLYPDFPKRSTLINDRGENVLAKHLGADAAFLADLHNWDSLSALIHAEIVEGRDVMVDFRGTGPADWASDSLTGTFLSKFIADFRERPVRVAPSSHYTIGGLHVDANAMTTLPHVYAAGELAGGVHGANRHGGTALVEAITFGRIAGRHAAAHMSGKVNESSASLLPDANRSGPWLPANWMDDLRRCNQRALGPIRDEKRLNAAAVQLEDFAAQAQLSGWSSLQSMRDVLRARRSVLLSECMRAAMLRRTETRGVHARSDFPNSSDSWLRKQVIRVQNGDISFQDVPV